LFLLFFKPFGLTTEKHLALYCLAYGCITFLVSLIFSVTANKLVQKDRSTWVFWKWIVSTLLLILCIAIANFFFGLLVFGTHHFNLKVFFCTIFNTLLLGIFPLVFLGSISLIQSRQKNVRTAEGLILPKNKKHFKTIQLGDKTFQIQDILYVEAMQNYALIYCKDLPKETIRSTLTKLENELNAHHIIRCHRSYLVNLNAIESVSGNAQGLKLHYCNLQAI